MILQELSNQYSLDDAVEFHDELNPLLFDEFTIKPEIRQALLNIAKHFYDNIKLPLDVVDVTISGSNAAYSYTSHSDIDLHIIVKIPDSPQYTELLIAKKNEYNTKHNITVKGIDVELYAQPIFEDHHSLGIYSLLKNRWISTPIKQKPEIDSEDVKEKYTNYRDRIKLVLSSDNFKIVKHTADTIKKIRKASLEKYGEFSTENLVFKMLRSQGWIDKLYEHMTKLQDQQLSIEGIDNEIE